MGQVSMTCILTPDEEFLISQHRDMVLNKRYGEVVSKYEAGKLVHLAKGEKLLPPGQKRRQWKK